MLGMRLQPAARRDRGARGRSCTGRSCWGQHRGRSTRRIPGRPPPAVRADPRDKVGGSHAVCQRPHRHVLAAWSAGGDQCAPRRLPGGGRRRPVRPGTAGREDHRRLTAEFTLPLNILYVPGRLGVARLAELGVSAPDRCSSAPQCTAPWNLHGLSPPAARMPEILGMFSRMTRLRPGRRCSPTSDTEAAHCRR
jgi:hypothetical protein